MYISFTDSYWKRIRKAANPAFSHRATVSLIPTANKHYNRYENELTKKLDGAAFDLNEVTAQISYEQVVGKFIDLVLPSVGEFNPNLFDSLVRHNI